MNVSIETVLVSYSVTLGVLAWIVARLERINTRIGNIEKRYVEHEICEKRMSRLEELLETKMDLHKTRIKRV